MTTPLITLTQVSLTATVPCTVVDAMPNAGGVVLGTAPPTDMVRFLQGRRTIGVDDASLPI